MPRPAFGRARAKSNYLAVKPYAFATTSLVATPLVGPEMAVALIFRGLELQFNVSARIDPTLLAYAEGFPYIGNLKVYIAEVKPIERARAFCTTMISG